LQDLWWWKVAVAGVRCVRWRGGVYFENSQHYYYDTMPECHMHDIVYVRAGREILLANRRPTALPAVVRSQRAGCLEMLSQKIHSQEKSTGRRQ
jgi:hypothetical protein